MSTENVAALFEHATKNPEVQQKIDKLILQHSQQISKNLQELGAELDFPFGDEHLAQVLQESSKGGLSDGDLSDVAGGGTMDTCEGIGGGVMIACGIGAVFTMGAAVAASGVVSGLTVGASGIAECAS